MQQIFLQIKGVAVVQVAAEPIFDTEVVEKVTQRVYCIRLLSDSIRKMHEQRRPFVKWPNFGLFPSLPISLLASLTSDQVHRVHHQRPTARSILGH